MRCNDFVGWGFEVFPLQSGRKFSFQVREMQNFVGPKFVSFFLSLFFLYIE